MVTVSLELIGTLLERWLKYTKTGTNNGCIGNIGDISLIIVHDGQSICIRNGNTNNLR